MEYGILYLVSTPIGNLEDITFRALNTLKSADLIAAEDTRHTLKLLNHFNIKKQLTSYYEHNKEEKGKFLIKSLLEGKNIAVVTDAGTPGISDPGEELVKGCIKEGIKVCPIPGAAALIAAVTVSGLPAGRFVFEGFLPKRKKEKKARLHELKKEDRTIVFYESPHKLRETLKVVLDVLGNRKIVLARELTKKFEEIIRVTVKEAVMLYDENPPRGEYVLVLEGCGKEEDLKEDNNGYEGLSAAHHVELLIKQGLNKKDAIREAAKKRGLPKRDVYAQVHKN